MPSEFHIWKTKTLKEDVEIYHDKNPDLLDELIIRESLLTDN